MAFRLELSPALRARIRAERAFAYRCYRADAVELGRTVLGMVVEIREAHPDLFAWAARGDGYGGAMVWEIVPEIARRLGVADFRRGKRPYGCRDESDLDLRNYAFHGIFGMRRSLLRADGSRVESPVWEMLQREPANGNPVAIALDRVAPPTGSADDMLARRIAEISQARGFAAALAWSPAIDGTRGAPAPDPEAEADDPGAAQDQAPRFGGRP